MNNQINRKSIMEEVMNLQAEWERRLRDLIKGRQHDELTQDEQRQYLQICQEFNRQIEEKMEIMYPDLRK
jgi:transcriptional regulatory protein LevR